MDRNHKIIIINLDSILASEKEELINDSIEFTHSHKDNFKILVWSEVPFKDGFISNWLKEKNIFHDDVIRVEDHKKVLIADWIEERKDLNENMNDYELYIIDSDLQSVVDLSQFDIVKKIFLVDWTKTQKELLSKIKLTNNLNKIII